MKTANGADLLNIRIDDSLKKRKKHRPETNLV